MTRMHGYGWLALDMARLRKQYWQSQLEGFSMVLVEFQGICCCNVFWARAVAAPIQMAQLRTSICLTLI